jgi:hypothetical protein
MDAEQCRRRGIHGYYTKLGNLANTSTITTVQISMELWNCYKVREHPVECITTTSAIRLVELSNVSNVADNAGTGQLL